jgi:hypothetical protein
MNAGADLESIVAHAKRKGYFAIEDFPGLRITQQQFLELGQLLQKKHVPIGPTATDSPHAPMPTTVEAKRIILALRSGIPAREGLQHYSVGRDQLLDRIRRDLELVAEKQSLVRFLNADIGQGKTHTLLLLREFAFTNNFAVSIVTLSRDACPLYDFMSVYHEIMWALRTADQREKPALFNIIDRYVSAMRGRSNAEILEIVSHGVPARIREIMAAYIAAGNLFRPNVGRQQLVLKFLSGEKMLMREIRQLGLTFRLDEDNALQILGELATTIRFTGFKGICILFDEAEAIPSFSYSKRIEAYANLGWLINQSAGFSHCYFIYATTPSFFESYTNSLPAAAGPDSILELTPLSPHERQEVAERISRIYSLASNWEPTPEISRAIRIATTHRVDERMGDCIRKVITILDEGRAKAERPYAR